MRIEYPVLYYSLSLSFPSSNYHRCYVAEVDVVEEIGTDLIGYVLFFHVLKANHNARQDPTTVIQDLFVKPLLKLMAVYQPLSLVHNSQVVASS